MTFRSLFTPQLFEPGIFSIRLAPFAKITGAGARTLANATATGAGSIVWLPVLGVGARTLANVTSSGAGAAQWPPITGVAARTLANAFGVGQAIVQWPPIAGTSARTLAAATNAGSGLVLPPVYGTSARTLAAATNAGVGSVGFVPIDGVGGAIFGPVTMAGAGTLQDPITGASSRTLAAALNTGAGTVVTPVLWTPALLPTPSQYWYDGQDNASITLVSGRVSRWANKGFQTGVDGTQSISARRPVFVGASNINGHPALRFDGAESLLTTTFSSYGGFDEALGLVYCNGSFTSFGVSVFMSDGNLSPHDALGLPVSMDTPSLLSAAWTGSAVELFQDGATVHVGSTALAVARPGAVFIATRLAGLGENGRGHLLNWNSLGNSPARLYTTDGDIGEILYLDYMPSVEDRQKIEGYMAWRWGTEGQLGLGHPYRFNRPTLPAGTGLPLGLLLTLTGA